MTKTWAELGFGDIEEPTTKFLPTTDTGREKFEALPEAHQREILGPKRFNAWKSGAYPMDQWWQRVEHWDLDEHGNLVQAWRDSIHVSSAPREPEGGWKWSAPPRN